ncbi:uncharacterized protein LOC121382061 [Gigantopelta aegis]|uniref:uncharacterized protein LOC121382061 n=1 Tax=Gigantopelta aegis TaxID=1735272 RepID=UPI001B88E123|nr:uncharacterized protein LOC121382061 [Gigantopelta aegis]
MTQEQRLTRNGMVAIFICMFMLDISCLSACESALFSRLPGYHVTSPIMRTVACPVNKCSLFFCAASCTNKQCLAVSFHRGNRICELHDKPIHSLEVTYEASQDWEYLQIRKDFVLDDDDWVLVFRATRLINQSAYDTWVNPGHYDDYPALRQDVPVGCLSVNGSHYCDRHYKSKLINIWNSANIAQVKLVLYENGVPMVTTIFNGHGTSSTTWFTQPRMAHSSWDDLYGNTVLFFSQNGQDVNFRRWYIVKSHNGCPNDIGWMVVLDKYVMKCPWEYPVNAGFPVFLYAPNQRKTQWDKEFSEADVMAIFVKFAT